jgi:hypothetical protein
MARRSGGGTSRGDRRAVSEILGLSVRFVLGLSDLLLLRGIELLDLFTVLEVSGLLLLPLVVKPSIGGGFLRAAAAYPLLAGLKGRRSRPAGKVQLDLSPSERPQMCCQSCRQSGRALMRCDSFGGRSTFPRLGVSLGLFEPSSIARHIRSKIGCGCKPSGSDPISRGSAAHD